MINMLSSFWLAFLCQLLMDICKRRIAFQELSSLLDSQRLGRFDVFLQDTIISQLDTTVKFKLQKSFKK